MEAKLAYIISALVLSFGGSLVAFQGKPDDWALFVMAVVAISQGLVTWRAFVTPPPVPPTA